MRILLLILLLFPSLSMAAGPEKVATLDRNLWPYPIENNKDFNYASANEILSFVRVFEKTKLNTEAKITAFTGISNINLQSVEKWHLEIRQKLQQNYQNACDNCTLDNWDDLVEKSRVQLPAELAAWALASERFYLRYLYEQARLATLFPRITSEIDSLDSAREITGSEFKDGSFLLTYDDGPSANTVKNNIRTNHTQSLTDALRELNIHATFFVLGERLVSSKPPKNMYDEQCLGSHGYQHKSHQKWDEWGTSLKMTRSALAEYQNAPYWFRPPYGQRHVNLIESLKEHNEKVMLWNIDSQDWNRKLTDQDVQDRVITLMLFWRKGIILYHDIYAKALNNLPQLQTLSSKAELTWTDCRLLPQ